MRAKLGATSRDQETGFVEIDSEKLIKHEKYAKDTDDFGQYLAPDFDIALIKLKRGMNDFGKRSDIQYMLKM